MIAEEEGLSQSQHAEEEEEEAFVMAKPDGEVTFQQQQILWFYLVWNLGKTSIEKSR